MLPKNSSACFIDHLSILTIATVVGLVGGCAKEKPVPPSESGLHVQWTTPTPPVVQVGEQAKLEVTIVNHLNRDVVIDNVSGGCSCTSFEIPERSLPAAKSVNVRLAYNSVGKPPGVQDISILVHPKEGVPVPAIAPLKINLKQSVILGRPRVMLFGVTADSEYQTAISISESVSGEIKWDQVSFSVSPAWMQGRLVKQDRKPDGSRVLELSGRIPFESGAIKGQISLTVPLMHGKDVVIEIPIEGSIRRSIEGFPSKLFLGKIEQNEEAAIRVTLKSVHSSPFRVEDVVVPKWCELLSWKSTETADGVMIDLNVKYSTPEKHLAGTDTIAFRGSRGEAAWETDVQCVYVFASE